MLDLLCNTPHDLMINEEGTPAVKSLFPNHIITTRKGTSLLIRISDEDAVDTYAQLEGMAINVMKEVKAGDNPYADLTETQEQAILDSLPTLQDEEGNDIIQSITFGLFA